MTATHPFGSDMGWRSDDPWAPRSTSDEHSGLHSYRKARGLGSIPEPLPVEERVEEPNQTRTTRSSGLKYFYWIMDTTLISELDLGVALPSVDTLGRTDGRRAHRCAGYVREENTLASSADDAPSPPEDWLRSAPYASRPWACTRASDVSVAILVRISMFSAAVASLLTLTVVAARSRIADDGPMPELRVLES